MASISFFQVDVQIFFRLSTPRLKTLQRRLKWNYYDITGINYQFSFLE